jgi:hypothetical protein
MAAREVDRERLRTRAAGFHPLLAALHWPSKAWADEELANLSYAAGDNPVAPPDMAAGGAQPAQTPEGDPVERFATEYADRLGDGLKINDAIRRIVNSALTDAAPPTLPDDVRAAYQQLNACLQLGHAGEGARPGDDREPFDAEETYQATLLMDVIDPVPFGGFSLGGVLAPLRVLSFWVMKQRALSFGETGAARLLGSLQEAASQARFHLVGHSFGASWLRPRWRARLAQRLRDEVSTRSC